MAKKEAAFFQHLDLGQQIIIWYLGCAEKSFAFPYLNQILDQACQLAKVKVVKTVKYVFPLPDLDVDGLTIVKILAESDLTAHTYPKAEEGRSITISFYACGEQARPAATIDFFKAALGAKKALLFQPPIFYKPGQPGWQEV